MKNIFYDDATILTRCFFFLALPGVAVTAGVAAAVLASRSFCSCCILGGSGGGTTLPLIVSFAFRAKRALEGAMADLGSPMGGGLDTKGDSGGGPTAFWMRRSDMGFSVACVPHEKRRRCGARMSILYPLSVACLMRAWITTHGLLEFIIGSMQKNSTDV